MKRIGCMFVLLLALALHMEAKVEKVRKAVYVVLDGIPADYMERLRPKAIFDIASVGTYGRAYTGGERGAYTQTPTVSAIGYTNMLTGTWMNKHNVNGNDNLSPNYNYWSTFRIAKAQKRKVTTGIFSSWSDNRKVLIGEGKPETGKLKMDYAFDGYELDTLRFPKKPKDLQIFDVDSVVAIHAAECIRKDAPDVSWVYLWYTDDASHYCGNGTFFDQYVNKTDELVAKIWEAVKYREKKFNEEWMIIVTSDHGRNDSGYGHGGQSDRERSVWMSTNKKEVNSYFHTSHQLALVDILPTICDYMHFDIPRDVKYELDGQSFLGKVDITDLKAMAYDSDKALLSWTVHNSKATPKIYVAVTNEYNSGGKDEWICLGNVPAGRSSYLVDLTKLPASKFYKFVVETPNNHINRWLYK